MFKQFVIPRLGREVDCNVLAREEMATDDPESRNSYYTTVQAH